MSNGYSTRSEDRKTYVPTLSELHRRHGRAKQFCSKTDCSGSCCAYDVLRSHEHGKPMACPKCSGTFAKPRLFSDDGSLVRPSGKGARGGKAPSAKSTTERERQLEAQVKDLQQQLAKPAAAAGQGEAETVTVDDVEMDTAESKVSALRSQIRDLKADLAWANSLDPRRQNLLAGGLAGYTTAVQLQLDSAVEQLEGCKTPSQRMAAAQQREAKCIKAEKAAVELAASANLALELATKEAQEAEHALQVARDELAKATAEVGALAAQRANGVFPATSLADTHDDAPPGSFAWTTLRGCGWKGSRISSPSSPRPWLLHSPDSKVNAALPRRRLPRTMRRFPQRLIGSRTMIPRGRSSTRVSGRRSSIEKGLKWPVSSRPPSSNVWSTLSPLSRSHASNVSSSQPTAARWDCWRGVRIGEARVPGPFDFDDPDAQPSVQEGSSGDDWQCVDTTSSSMPDGSLWAVGFERQPPFSQIQ